jgi:hypothetical protein
MFSKRTKSKRLPLFRILSEIFVYKQKLCKDGRVITECHLLLGEILSDEFKDKNKILCANAQKPRFSQNAATKRMERISDNWKHQLKEMLYSLVFE